jgi:hypothetical protein
MITRLACVLVLVAACGKSDAPADPGDHKPVVEHKSHHKEEKPLPPARAQPKLAVTLDGKPLTMAGAVAWRAGNGAIKVVVSSVPLACDDVQSDMRMLRDGEVDFNLHIAQLLQPDGTFAPMLTDVSTGGTSVQHATKIAMTGTGSAAEATTVDVEFDAAEMMTGGHPFALKGTIDALGCASPPVKPTPPLPAEMPATLTVAGVTLPIRGARLTTGSMPSLELTTGGEACEPAQGHVYSDYALSLTWFDVKKPIGQISLTGEKIGRQVADQTFDKKKAVVSPLPLAPGEITLAIDVLISGYPVKVTGKVMAQVCK